VFKGQGHTDVFRRRHTGRPFAVENRPLCFSCQLKIKWRHY